MNMKTMVIAIGILLGFCAGIHFYAEHEKAKFDASLPQPPTEVQAAETETETDGGHWHGDEWHAEPHEENTPRATGEQTATSTNKGFELLSIEEQKEAIRIFYLERGLELPPKGHGYVWDTPGVPKLDENGQPLFYKFGEPLFEVQTQLGFAPTRAQHERYKDLNREYNLANLQGDYAKADNLAAEIRDLRAAAHGEIPTVTYTLVVTDPNADIETLERHAQLGALQRTYEEYRKVGLDYLVP